MIFGAYNHAVKLATGSEPTELNVRSDLLIIEPIKNCVNLSNLEFRD